MRQAKPIGLLLVVVALACWWPLTAPTQDPRWQALSAAGLKAYQQGRHPEAEKQFEAALEEAEGFGSRDLRIATSLNNLAVLYKLQGRYREAEPLLLRALAIREQALGSEHPDVAQSLDNLAGLYHSQGYHREAEPLLRRALAIYESRLGAEHPGVAQSLNSLAGLYQAQGRYAEAEPLYQRALAIYEKVLGSEHPALTTGLESYASLLRRMKPLVSRLPRSQATTMEVRAKTIRAKAIRTRHAGENPAN